MTHQEILFTESSTPVSENNKNMETMLISLNIHGCSNPMTLRDWEQSLIKTSGKELRMTFLLFPLMLLKKLLLDKWEIGSVHKLECLLILKNSTFGSDIKRYSPYSEPRECKSMPSNKKSTKDSSNLDLDLLMPLKT
jgi:hypothetical protein